MPNSVRFFVIFSSLCACLLPQIAFAHSPIKGIGSLFNGALHPVFAPAQLLLLLGLGLLFGQHQPGRIKKVVYLLIAGLAAGLSGSVFMTLNGLDLTLLLIATLVGLLVLSNVNVPVMVLLVLAGISGLVIGLDSFPQGLSGKANMLALFGSGVGAYLLMLYMMALSESFSHKHWQKVGVRVLASWISASALMVLALSFAS